MALESFQHLTGQVAPLVRNDVDTDQIIPAQYLTQIGREGYGEGLFKRLREEQADFILNQDRFAKANILVAGSNFGCGSSREHAVWALMDYGFRVVIAQSFADIFFSNAGKNGLVLIQLPEEIVSNMQQTALEQQDPYLVHVDLERQKVCLPDDSEYRFDFDPFRKECILRGYDDLDYILSHKAEIEEWQKKREEELFFATTEPNRPLT